MSLKTFLAAALLLVAAASVVAGAQVGSPRDPCTRIEQIIDKNCKGFFICRNVNANGNYGAADCSYNSGSPDYALCFYACPDGFLYDYENKRCRNDGFTC